jgi:hypothetical protein
MKAQCSGCGIIYEVTGGKAFAVLTGGLDCPNCKGNVDIIIAEGKI